MSRIEKAVKDLIRALDNGAEFPDVDWKIAAKHKVSLDSLIEAYDKACEYEAQV